MSVGEKVLSSPDELLTDRVSARAAESPDCEAFRAGGNQLSYGQLADSMRRFSNWLHRNEFAAGERVGILCRRSLESVQGVYGTLYAGGVFVPMDPDASDAFLRSIISDCGVRYLVCDPQTRRRAFQLLSEGVGEPLVVMGLSESPSEAISVSTWDDLAGHDRSEQGEARVRTDDLAYIMYTSGSTGRPKGIMHTHRSGLGYARLSADLYGIVPGDRIANHSPLHFDMSTLGYLTGPYAGATTVMVSEAHTKMPASLSALIETERISIWYSVPTALIQLLQYGALEKRDLTCLRWVLYGGEPFAPQQLGRLMDIWPRTRFSNVYGPAEVNQCTYYHVSRDEIDECRQLGTVPIGWVWSDTEGKVVDEQGRVVGEGEVGELVIHSVTMMQGYWRQPALNEAAFLELTASDGKGKVFYRTGDLVRRDDRGRLILVGRMDRQIKTRGYRVELDGVESILADHGAVAEAAVFAVRQAAAGGGEDAIGVGAAVSLLEGASVTELELRAYLVERLPTYAVPSDLKIVETFPRTGTGKIDRRTLAETASA